jgi:DNA-binding MltR family transcriptional regulator
MVTDIKKVPDKQAYDLRRTDRLLGEGVIKGEIQEIINNKVNFNEIIRDGEILVHYLTTILMNSPPLKDINLYRRLIYSDFYPPYILKYFGDNSDIRINKVIEEYNKILREYLFRKEFDNQIDDLIELILNNEMDIHHEIEGGSSSLLMESFYRINRSIPSELLLADMSNKEKSINKKYKIDDKCFFMTRAIKTHCIDHYFGSKGIKLSPNIQTKLNSRIRPKDFFRNILLYEQDKVKSIISNVKNAGLWMPTRSYIQEILSRYGLENIVNVCAEDFLIEDLGIDFPRPPEN